MVQGLISTLAESRAQEQSYATGSPNQRKIVLAKGKFWVFFSDGKNLAYSTSLDGNDWNSMTKTRIETGPTAESVCIWNDKQTGEICYSKQRHEDRTLEVGRGALESNGSISWSSSGQEIRTRFRGQFPGTFTCSSKRDDIWVGTTTMEKEENRHTEIWRSDGLKARIAYDVNFGPNTAIRPPIILPTPTGVLLIYGRTHHSDKLYVTSTTDGREWISPWLPPGNFCLGGAVVQGGKLCYCGPSEGSCRFFTFKIDARTMEHDLVLEPDNVIQATMASDGDNRLIAIYTSKGPSCAIFYRLSEDLGETWGERRTLVDGESIAGFSLTSSKDITNNEIGVSWSSGLVSPFKVRFGKIRV